MEIEDVKQILLDKGIDENIVEALIIKIEEYNLKLTKPMQSTKSEVYTLELNNIYKLDIFDFIELDDCYDLTLTNTNTGDSRVIELPIYPPIEQEELYSRLDRLFDITTEDYFKRKDIFMNTEIERITPVRLDEASMYWSVDVIDGQLVITSNSTINNSSSNRFIDVIKSYELILIKLDQL